MYIPVSHGALTTVQDLCQLSKSSGVVDAVRTMADSDISRLQGFDRIEKPSSPAAQTGMVGL